MNTNTFLKNTAITGLFVSLFIPLIVFNSSFFPFITGKNIAFRAITDIVFACWVILAVREPLFRPKKSWLTYAIGIFTACILVSDLLGPNPVKSLLSNFERMEGWITLIHFAMYYLVLTSIFTTQKLWERFFQVSILVSLITAVYGFFQLAGKIVINQGGARLDATFGNATYFAVFMLFNIFFAILCLLRAYHTPIKDKVRTFLLGYTAVAVVLDSIILFYTATRGTTLGLIGGLILAMLLIAIFEKEKMVLRKISAGILVCLVVVSGTLFLMRDSAWVKASPSLGRLTSITLADGHARFMVWGMAFEGFKEKPILGWGQENFNFVFNKYYNPGMWGQEQWFDRTHDIFFDWLISGGIVGLLIYLSFFVLALYYLWHKNRGFFNFSVTEKALLTGLLAGYFFHNIFVFDNLVSYMLFATLLAYLSRTGSEGEGCIGGTTEVASDIANSVWAPSVIVVLCVVLWVGSIRPMISGTALIDAIRPQASGATGNLESFKKVLDMGFAKPEIREQLMQTALAIQGANVDLKTKKDFVDLARAEFEKQLVEVPGDARYELFYGMFLNRLHLYDDALVHLKRASELSPKKQTIIFELASTYLGAGQYDQALPILKYAYELDPQYVEARIIYAIGALYTKNNTLATSLLKDIPAEQLATDDRLLGTYITLGNFAQVAEIWKFRVAQDPKNPQAHLSLAAAYLKAGRRADAVKEIQTTIDLNPALKQQGEFYINEIKAGRNP
ncbi:MAG: hypothetical protein RLZZ347_468 [Candidatus Parcubacteria bacterium]|jgi:O-antigen ligase/Tfp pilus assembly protein PilF